MVLARRLAAVTAATCCLLGVEGRKRIVGGTEAVQGSYPFLAYMYGCGAMVVDEHWVLTAAHCEELPGGELGAHDTSDLYNTDSFEVSAWFPHPLYDAQTFDYDFQMLYIEEPIDLDRYPNITLNDNNAAYQESGVDLIAAGWGTTSSGGESSDVLLEVTIPILSNEDCRQTSYGSNPLYGPESITDQMICAGVTGMDACQGDSGGPLFDVLEDGSFLLVGVTSWGEGCAFEGYPGIWARVSAEIDWIRSVMEYGEECIDFNAQCCSEGSPFARHLNFGGMQEVDCELCGAFSTCLPEPLESFTCDDGCEIPPSFVNDDYCDCSSCEDEESWTCDECVGCPAVCGDSSDWCPGYYY